MLGRIEHWRWNQTSNFKLPARLDNKNWKVYFTIPPLRCIDFQRSSIDTTFGYSWIYGAVATGSRFLDTIYSTCTSSIIHIRQTRILVRYEWTNSETTFARWLRPSDDLGFQLMRAPLCSKDLFSLSGAFPRRSPFLVNVHTTALTAKQNKGWHRSINISVKALMKPVNETRIQQPVEFTGNIPSWR